MNRVIDMRHAGVLGLTMLLLVAVISPACLVAATPAMATPMGEPHDGCGSTPGDVNVCPHHEEMQSDATLASAPHLLEGLIPIAPAPLDDQLLHESLTASIDTGRVWPPDRPVPLRL